MMLQMPFSEQGVVGRCVAAGQTAEEEGANPVVHFERSRSRAHWPASNGPPELK